MSRPNCSVKGCLNIADYGIFVQNGQEDTIKNGTLIVKPIFEEISLCAKHHSVFEEALKLTDLNKVPDKTKEKVQFD